MNSTISWNDQLWDKSIGLRAIFYIVPPSESVENLDDVPHYLDHAIPWFYLFIIIDWLVGLVRNNLSFESRDAMGSITAGAMSQLSALIGQKNVEIMIYVAVYNYYHIFDLTYSSWTTWILAALLYDLGYYVTHRLGHEMNFGWAGMYTKYNFYVITRVVQAGKIMF